MVFVCIGVCVHAMCVHAVCVWCLCVCVCVCVGCGCCVYVVHTVCVCIVCMWCTPVGGVESVHVCAGVCARGVYVWCVGGCSRRACV